MSERANFRGRGGTRGSGGDHHRGGRGGSGGGGGGRGGGGAREGGTGHHSGQQADKPKKENILDLAKYMDKEIIVKFTGGREGSFFIPFSPKLARSVEKFFLTRGSLQ